MKKQLNIDVIQSELRGGSAFFPGYKGSGSPTPPAEPEQPKPDGTTRTRGTGSTPVPPVRGVPVVPPAKGAKRIMKQRHPFDIYRDQYDALQELALEERKQGGIGSMSAMVREALDTLIATRRKAKK